jgi:hypothetical protein
MTTVALVVRTHDTKPEFKRWLMPLEPEDIKCLEKFEPGEVVTIDVRRARNIKRHRLHFVLFEEAVKLGCLLHGHRFHNKDAMRAFTYVCCGWADYYDLGPVRVPVPRTINWDAIDEGTFERIFETCVLYLAEELQPECPSITTIADDLVAKGVERTDLRHLA